MTQGYVRTARWEDVPILADNMREADVAEVKAYSGRTPREALYSALNYPQATNRTICLGNGLPVGMFGVCPTHEPGVGIVWMLTSNDIKAVHRQFLRESREQIKRLCEGYRLVFNFTDARNHVHHRWIKWSGFSIIKKHENFGVEQRPFLEFTRIVETQDV